MSAIDVHAHWFPPEWIALLEGEGHANGAKMGKNAKGWTNITIPGVALVSSFQPDMVHLETMMSEMDRAAIGSDYNFDAGYPQPVEFVLRIPELTKREREMILCENAVRVLKLKERYRHVYEALHH